MIPVWKQSLVSHAEDTQKIPDKSQEKSRSSSRKPWQVCPQVSGSGHVLFAEAEGREAFGARAASCCFVHFLGSSEEFGGWLLVFQLERRDLSLRDQGLRNGSGPPSWLVVKPRQESLALTTPQQELVSQEVGGHCSSLTPAPHRLRDVAVARCWACGRAQKSQLFPAGGNSSHPPFPAPHPLANSTEPPLGGRAGWAATCEGACPGGTRPRPYPPGVAFFQRCTLGLGRVLDDSSRLPKKIHRHEGVLRDAALESKGHPFLGCSRWEPWPGGATRTREGQERTASAPTSQPSKDQVTPSAPQGLWFFSRRRNELILSRLLKAAHEAAGAHRIWTEEPFAGSLTRAKAHQSDARVQGEPAARPFPRVSRARETRGLLLQLI